MPFFVGALNALCSFRFYWLDFLVVLFGAKIMKKWFVQKDLQKKTNFESNGDFS